MKLRALELIFGLALFCSCNGQKCEDLPSQFKSHDEALNAVRQTEFQMSDKIDTPESSWVKGAEFMSCGDHYGYFILKTNKGEYIHQGVPQNLWEGFKSAESRGTYYNDSISGKYQLQLK